MSQTSAEKQTTKEQTYNAAWLTTFEGFENYALKQAEDELSSLKQLAQIICQQLLNTS